MKFNELSHYLEKLDQTSSRIEITKILADLFTKTDGSEIDKVSYLLLGALAPQYKGIVFNIAEKMMLRVLVKTYQKDEKDVGEKYRHLGDIGSVSYEYSLKIENQANNLNVTDVYDRLIELAIDSGEESQERKVDKMSSLLSELDPLSAKYVSRIPIGRLRLGFSDKTILDALSWMETGGKTKKQKLEMAYNILPDVGLLAKDVKSKGIDKTVDEIKPQLGTPILPMLAARLKSPKEMIQKMKRVFVEPKFDGLRIQLHYKKSGFKDRESLVLNEGKITKVKAFTRNLNETSWMFPELTDIEKYINGEEAILDTEAVGVDSQRKAMANFQTTMTRRRKHDIENISQKISIRFNVFDIMYKNGKSLVNETYEKRREILKDSIKSGELIVVVDYLITEDPDEISREMEKELGGGLEGIIVKKAESNYIAGRTGWRWVKMKEAEGQKAKLADTLDAVIMGYSAGRGKRVSFGVGQFLVGINDGDVIKSVTKVGTGLTDEQFRELKSRLSGLETKIKPKNYEVNKILEPDFWVQPDVIVELAADEITKSPTHTSGYALRFPRLVKFRDDKNWTQTTSLPELKSLIKLQ